MAGPLATAAAEIRRDLEALRPLTEELGELEQRIAGVVRDLAAAKQRVDGLGGAATAHLAAAMVAQLGTVRRAAIAVREHVAGKRRHKPHEYYESLSELGGYLDGKLAAAIAHFKDVEKHNPSALRRAGPGRVISVPIERGNDNASRFAG